MHIKPFIGGKIPQRNKAGEVERKTQPKIRRIFSSESFEPFSN
jgi:hypothetical protein